MRLRFFADGFDLDFQGHALIRHRTDAPFVFLGHGEPDIQMARGNFKIDDYVSARIPLTYAKAAVDGDGVDFSILTGQPAILRLRLTTTAQKLTLLLHSEDPSFNRIWLRFQAEADERVYGCGEQMSYFNLRGRRFPLWTSEPGVGRDKSTLLTFLADQTQAGGDYYCTNYPQPTFLSSRRYALHMDTTAYTAFDFRHAGFHELEAWETPHKVEIFAEADFPALVGALSARFGRQPPLPDWVLDGAIIGLKCGERGFARLKTYQASGAAVSALWCEDWVGLRETSFGRRLFWDWRWNAERYPDLPQRIKDLAVEGVRFMGYVNPYLCVDGALYPEALARGFLAQEKDADAPYLVDFGEFFCGVVDFTQQEAADWFAETVIGQNMLDVGLSGWMADFGEYLPHDVRLASGLDGMLAHNAWPTLWAKVNAQALDRRGKTGEALYFMRAGFTGVQAHCPLLWAGDQSVDFSRHDGLPTVICAALSSGLLGNAYHHSDIGGYTSLFDNVRTPELIMRWSEMAAFAAVMRTHEGNRPDQNLQVDQDPMVLAHFARMTRIYRHLKPYLKALSQEAATQGLPLQRPLFLHFPDDAAAYDTQVVYLLGEDLLVAPVLQPDTTRWQAYLPKGCAWVHVWSGARFDGGGTVEVDAPLGHPPVFYRQGSHWHTLFAQLSQFDVAAS